MSYWAAPGLKKFKSLIPEKERVSKVLIIKVVCDYFKIDSYRLHIKNRDRQLAYARHLCIYFLRENGKMTYKDIGILFKRDHTTVIFARNKVKGQLTTKWENVFQGDVEKITKLIFNKL